MFIPRYLSWIEQAYPNGGRQQLETATIRCLKGYMRLEPAPEKLKNSHTFLNICLKFVRLKAMHSFPVSKTLVRVRRFT